MTRSHPTLALRCLASAALLALGSGAVARAGQPSAETLARLEVHPTEARLVGPRAEQQLLVTAVRVDGTRLDVTGQAIHRVEARGVAHVSVTGRVEAVGDGSTRIVTEFGGLTTSVGLVVENSRATVPVSYRFEIAPILARAGCNSGACHGNFNGKGGFRLSLRGDDPVFDLAAITRDTFARRTSAMNPEASLLIAKPTGVVAHEGGLRFRPDSVEARRLASWIREGCQDDGARAPRLERLEVTPSERIVAAPSLEQRLVVTAVFRDGSRRDVTRQAAFDVSDPTIVRVSPEGVIVADRPTETAVAVRYVDVRAVCRLVFLPDRPGFAWRPRAEANQIDRHVFAKLKAIQVLPSEPATDAVFLRRAYLDAIGRLPSAEEARTYLEDERPDKRSRVVAALLRRPEFADHWALKWADLLRNEEKAMGDKGVWVFQRWLRDQIDADLPLDEFARRLLVAKGSTWTNPAASFYRTNRDPQTAAETVGQVFLGVRLQCARCHNHPFDDWTQDDYYGLAAVFGNLRHKDLDNQRKDNLDKHEINGDEVVYLEGAPTMVQPRSGETLEPKAPRGPRLSSTEDLDARDDLARWLTANNRQFARNLANRVWFHLMGRGIVEPVDDFRESNPPSNPPLLEALTDHLVRKGFLLRPLVGMIMTSNVYALGSEPNETNREDETNFARASVRLLPAEVLLDAIGQALDKPSSFKGAPAGMHASQLAGARMGGPFLETFGKPQRLLTCECERSDATTLSQAFQLINGESVRSSLEATSNRIGRLLESGRDAPGILEELVLATLTRRPSASEQAEFLQHVARASDRRQAWEDVAWALINSKEFLLRH